MRVEQIAIPAIRFVVNRPRLAGALFRYDRWGSLFGPDRYRYPYPLYERIRAEGPVAYHRLYQSWFVTGYDEAREILASDQVESRGQLDLLLAIRPYSHVRETAKRMLSNFLLVTDPPEHTRLRRLVSRAFTPRQIARLEPAVDRIAHRLLDDIAGNSRPDIVASFAAPLPIDVISELLGVPPERWPWVQRTSTEIATLLNPFISFDPAAVSDTIDELGEYFGALADQRRQDPADDLITALVQAEEEGDRLSRDELLAMVVFLLFAGHETTTGLLGNSIVALAEHPEQRALIRNDPGLWPNAVEELIRWDSPVQSDGRTAGSELVLAGQPIAKGQSILVFLGAANRDPRRYDDPNTLRLDRDDPQPISFGHGIHHCLGHALARLELRVGLRAFLDAFDDYTIDTEAIRWKESVVIRGPLELPVDRSIATSGAATGG